MESVPKIRYVALDGLRGWAALSVVLWHLFVEVFPYSGPAHDWLVVFGPINGNLAVYLFFVISGFSLSIGYVQRHDLQSLARMAVSRYPRLALPILGAALLVYLSVITGFTPMGGRPLPVAAFPFFTPTFADVFRFSLFDVFFRYNIGTSFISPLWTMPIELTGSALVLTLLAVLGRWRWRLWGYIALAALLVALNSIYVLFVAGLIFAEISERWAPRRRIENAGLVLLLTLGLLAPWIVQNQAAMPFYLMAAGLCAAVFWLKPLRGFFERPVSRFLGHISFPLYLTHGPLLHSFSVWAFWWFNPLGWAHGATNLAVCAVSLPVFLVVAIAFSPVNDAAIRISRAFGAFTVSRLWQALGRRDALV